jgi:hypothetical protein
MAKSNHTLQAYKKPGEYFFFTYTFETPFKALADSAAIPWE